MWKATSLPIEHVVKDMFVVLWCLSKTYCTWNCALCLSRFRIWILCTVLLVKHFTYFPGVYSMTLFLLTCICKFDMHIAFITTFLLKLHVNSELCYILFQWSLFEDSFRVPWQVLFQGTDSTDLLKNWLVFVLISWVTDHIYFTNLKMFSIGACWFFSLNKVFV